MFSFPTGKLVFYIPYFLHPVNTNWLPYGSSSGGLYYGIVHQEEGKDLRRSR